MIKYLIVIALLVLAKPAQADIITMACQFTTDSGKISLQHPSNCASPLVAFIIEEKERSSFFSQVLLDKAFIVQYFDKTSPPACPPGFQQILPIQGRIVSQIYRHYKADYDYVVYESLRHCQDDK
jgi:hypothetical protein